MEHLLYLMVQIIIVTEKIKLAFTRPRKTYEKLIFLEKVIGIFYFEDKYENIFTCYTTSKFEANIQAGTLSIVFSANNEKIITEGLLKKPLGMLHILDIQVKFVLLFFKTQNQADV